LIRTLLRGGSHAERAAWISIRRETVSDVVHLTAELVENATSFSEAGTPVMLASQLQGNGWTLC
jgi:hypothetical protein